MSQIYLSSVPSAVKFYKKYGFLKYSQEGQDGLSIMRKYIDKKNGGATIKTRKTKKRKTKTRRSTRRKK